MTEDAVEGLNECQNTYVTMCDLTEALGCVDIEVLLLKLDQYGIRGSVLLLLSSYLYDRDQFVAFNNIESDIISISCGVPQGSVLTPLLLLL